MGLEAGSVVAHGGDNIGLGYQALNVLGAGAGGNIGIGYQPGLALVTGMDNILLGVLPAVASNATRSISIGRQATCNGDYGISMGYLTTVGTNAIAIGRSNTAGHDAAIVIGNNGTSTAANQLTFSDITEIRAGTTVIHSISDMRDKTSIEDLPASLGLDFINKVKPRRFKWDRRDGNNPNTTWNAGLIAQEAAGLEVESDAEWLNLVSRADPEHLEVAPSTLLMPMVKAIQELSAQVQHQVRQLGELVDIVDAQNEKIKQNKETIKQLQDGYIY